MSLITVTIRLAFLLVVCLTPHLSSFKAHAQTIEDACVKKWDTDPNFNNSKYKECISDLTNKLFNEMGAKSCTTSACFYRLARVQIEGIGEYDSVYQGSGYIVKYKSADYGRDVLILNPQGRLTIFGQCGTCNGMDYDNGPLKSAIIRPNGRDLILEVPKTEESASVAPDPALAALTSDSLLISNFDANDNRDIDGANLRTLKGVDLQNCAAACGGEASCHAYSYDKWNRFCFLKSTMIALRLDPRSTAGVRNDLSAPPTSSDSIRMERYRGKFFLGSGFKMLGNSNFDTCEEACHKDQLCVAFSFQKKEQNCRLFATTGEYFANSETDSGVKKQSP